jgi:hypothetical protein
MLSDATKLTLGREDRKRNMAVADGFGRGCCNWRELG